MDLAAIDSEILLARGRYATVRGQHEDKKKELSMLCGQLQACASQLLRRMQPDNDEVPMTPDDVIKTAYEALGAIATCATEIEALARQRADLKQTAWGKR